MAETRYDVLGIGNAIFDILGHVSDETLDGLGLAKGSMRLVDAAESEKVDAAVTDTVRVAGGSAGNTVAGVASLGGRAAFIGKVADDATGAAYIHDMHRAGITFRTPPLAGETPTATSIILVTPDGERTMNTFLGAAQELTVDDIDDDLVDGAAITFLEGYLFDPAEAKAAFRKAAERANTSGRIAALTLSDAFCIERHRDDFRQWISSGQIGLLFANVAEARALHQTDDLDAACRAMAQEVPHVVVTMGGEGARVLTDGIDEVVPAVGTNVRDLTGAGDLFAGGYMFAHARGVPPVECARLGALAASEVISHFGARPQTTLADLAAKSGFSF